jgi:hypothetical protein
VSDAGAKLLRNTAAGLRLKAEVGLAASAAARDLATLVPSALEKAVEKALESGDLLSRWKQALDDARSSIGPDPTDDEVTMAALADVLAWHRRVAGDTARRYLDKVEGDRRALEGRAAGIEEALGVLFAQQDQE